MFDLRKSKLVATLLMVVFLLVSGTAWAAKDKVRFVSVSWTGVTVKTELGVAVLKSLGYNASNTMVSVPIAYKAMEMGDADIFLGNWMPSMSNVADKFFEKGSVVKYVANMPGAKYTLAAPSYVVEAGLDDFEDIAKYGEKLGYEIHGIEQGNDGNKVIQTMIDKDMYGLGDFELVPSSEAGMLSEVQSRARDQKWIVFLGWSPHYMNEIIDMQYLKGSTAETFGANDGTATVYTNIRKGFAEEKPNVAKFLRNFKFPVAMMNEVMAMLHADKKLTTDEAGLQWIKKHPEVYQKWLQGVETVDGEKALAAFEKFLESA